MSYVILGLGIFTLLIGFLYTWRFLLWATKKAQFNSLVGAFLYAAVGAGLLALAVALFMTALPQIGA